MSPRFRESFDSVASWPLDRVLGVHDLMTAISEAEAEATVDGAS
jgi:hypothetical protein